MSQLEQSPRSQRVYYPESDGQPLGETDQHRDLMNNLIFALKWFLRNLQAYVAGNLFVYFEEGNPKAVVAPDVFVVLDVPQRQRRIYQAWREGGRMPNVVIELISRRTSQVDQTTKPQLYAHLGVAEYFLFDPIGDHLQPQLQGYRLVDGHYQRMTEFPLRSTTLGLELRAEENNLRLYNAATGERLPTSDEEVFARIAAEAARKEMEHRLLREVESRRLEADARRAAELRAIQAEAELTRLRAELSKRSEPLE